MFHAHKMINIALGQSLGDASGKMYETPARSSPCKNPLALRDVYLQKTCVALRQTIKAVIGGLHSLISSMYPFLFLPPTKRPFLKWLYRNHLLQPMQTMEQIVARLSELQ